jgi:L-threonylcarbamoyladenylate synthase
MLPIKQAVDILRKGGLVAFPTETVYGLGADASNQEAVHKIFKVKERPFGHPLIVHLADISQLSLWAREVSADALRLAASSWPGPLTLVLKKQPQVLKMITGDQETIALRIPNHPVALALLGAFDKGIAAPSANKFTHVSPTCAADVVDELGDKVDMVLEGGKCVVGLESTIVDMSGEHPVLLRPGMISRQTIAQLLGRGVLLPDETKAAVVSAPGRHVLHYAPRTPTRLLAKHVIGSFLAALPASSLPLALLVHSQIEIPSLPLVKIIRMSNQARVFAHELYHTLRSLDREQFKCISIEEVPAGIEWDAIRDRLLKATAAR